MVKINHMKQGNTIPHAFVPSLEETDNIFLDKRALFDGGGSYLKYNFLEHVKKLDKTFNCCFEWCAGIGEIGLKLLEKNIVSELVIADINPEAINTSKNIVKSLGLEKNVRFYISDGLKNIPHTEKFDLVVGNPPNYFNLQKNHRIGFQLYDDLRPMDKNWEIHKDFFDNITNYLNKNAILIIEEIDIYKTKVFIEDKVIPYDIRPEEPIATFVKMANKNNLKIFDIVKIMEDDGVDTHFIKLIYE